MLEEILKELQAIRAAIESNGKTTHITTTPAVAPAVEEEDDDLLGEEAEEEEKLTQTQVIEAVKQAAERNKEKTKAVLAGFKVKRASEIPETEWAKALVALGKIKK